jgi:cation diffusion facilitator family transporter
VTEARDRQVLRVIWIEGAANLAVLSLKLVVGLATGSLAVLSDAVHSLSDLANNGVAWFIVRLSTLLAFEIALGALRRGSQPILHEDWALALMGVVLTVNIGLAIWENRWARRLDSDILKADAGHTLADVLTTLVVIGGWQLSARGFPWLDRLCALGVAGLVLTLGYGLFKRAIPVLVDQVALEPEAIAAAAAALPGVEAVHDVRSRWTGAGAVVDLIVEVDAHLPTGDSHDISDRVETLLRRRFGALEVTVHVEPRKP